MLAKKVLSLFSCNSIMKMTFKVFLALLLIGQSSFGTSNSVSNDILNPNNTAYDITFTDDTTNKIYINKTYIEVAQVVKEIEKIANALVPRDINIANCSSTGCPIDSVQCDAVTELPYCPDGSVLNTVRDMCQKDPDVFNCPIGFTYDSTIKQCVKPLDCPNGGTYVVSRQRCEYKRIYECPAGYTQSGNTCIAPPVCPNNATFDATLLKCTLNPTFQCADAGWTYDPATNKCFYAPPTCPSGGSYNTTYDKCISNPLSTTCPSGYTYDNNYKMCISNPNCSAGDYDPVTKKCLLSYTPTCATGYTYDSTRLRCEKIPDCPTNTSYNPTTNRCEQNKNSACLSVGGDWNGNNCSVVSSYDAVLISSAYLCPYGGVLSGKTCLKTSYVSPICPSGYSLTGDGRCYITSTCSLSGQMDNNVDMCWLDFSKICSSGTYDASLDKCSLTSTCASSGTLNQSTNLCTTAASYGSCSAGYSFDNTLKLCTSAATCSKGVLNPTLDRCEQDYTPVCSVGWTFNSATKMCEKDPFCVVGTYDKTLDKCTLDFIKSCPSGYSLSTDKTRCELSPSCTSGTTYNPTTNRCEKVIICPAGSTWDVTLNSCTVNSTCTWPATLNTTTNRCEYTTSSNNCPSGTTFNSSTGLCTAIPTCPSGGVYDTAKNLCTSASTGISCVAGYTYNATYATCIATPVCSQGTYNATFNVCLTSFTPTCASGYSYVAARNRCEKTPPDCPAGTTYNATTNRCEQGANSACTAVGGTYNGSGMCVNYTYSEPTITPTVYQIGWWNCSSGCSGQFPQIRSSVSDSIWANGSATNGFYAALIMVARAAGATSWSFKTPKCTEFSWGDDDSCIKYNACNTTVSGRHANVSTNCLFVTDKYGDYPTEFTHNAPVQITTRDTGGGKPWYYAEATISKCQNLVLVPATKDYPSHYKCMDTSSTCSAGYTLVAEEGGGYSCRAGSAAQASCPAGYAADTTGKCYANPTCPSSGSYDGNNDVCFLSYGRSCPSGMWYDSNSNTCIVNAICASGGTLNASIDQCTINGINDCQSGYGWNNTYSTCTASPSCVAGTTLNTSTDNCQVSGGYTCNSSFSLSGTTCYQSPACTVGTYNTSNKKCDAGSSTSCTGLTLDTSKDVCYVSSTCLSGGNFDTTADKCWFSYSPTCTSGTYDATSLKCTLDAICDSGTLIPSLDKCQISRDITCAQGVKDPTTGKCTFTAVCQTGATLNATGCNEDPIPLTCPSGTDTTLDVCYSDVDACKVNSTYPSTLASTLTYSDALNICIVDENIVCASSLTWSANYLKCEAVPICYNGMYNPENDFCYIKTKECPINASYPCKGPIGNQWCSPYECNPKTNQCGYAECPAGIQPSLTAEMSPSYNANLISNSSDSLCTEPYCNIANSSRFTYCGLEAACPSGFGVFEQNSKCFVRECPKDSFQENNKCYSLGCPKGTTEQGSGKCLVN